MTQCEGGGVERAQIDIASATFLILAWESDCGQWNLFSPCPKSGGSAGGIQI